MAKENGLSAAIHAPTDLINGAQELYLQRRLTQTLLLPTAIDLGLSDGIAVGVNRFFPQVISKFAEGDALGKYEGLRNAGMSDFGIVILFMTITGFGIGLGSGLDRVRRTGQAQRLQYPASF